MTIRCWPIYAKPKVAVPKVIHHIRHIRRTKRRATAIVIGFTCIVTGTGVAGYNLWPRAGPFPETKTASGGDFRTFATPQVLQKVPEPSSLSLLFLPAALTWLLYRKSKPKEKQDDDD